MAKVLNNRIYIGRGETYTLDIDLKYRDGSPYRIAESINNPYILFTVKGSVYDENIIFVKALDMSLVHKFANTSLAEYDYDEFDDLTPPVGDPNGETEETIIDAFKLHVNKSGEYKYYDYDNSKWIEYNLQLLFNIDYSDTNDLEFKKYVYDITLLGGELGEDLFSTINHKTIIQEYNEFIVGGSLSE